MQFYNTLNVRLVDLIQGNGKRILDCGCGTGVLGEAIKKIHSVQVVGITINAEEHEAARLRIDEAIYGDLTSYDITKLGQFDYIICSHVLEHLYDPWAFLPRLAVNLAESGQLIIALPNIFFWKQRIDLMRGQFRYTDEGILDKSHIRFFDYQSAQALIRSSGYKIKQFIPDGHFPLPCLRNIIPSSAKRFDAFISNACPGLFAHQFIFVASKK